MEIITSVIRTQIKSIKKTLRAYDAAFEILAGTITEGNLKGYIEGEIVQPVFRKA